MDIKIWGKTLIAWLNSLSSSVPIDSVNQINHSHLTEVIKKFNVNLENDPVKFLKEIFPNLIKNDAFELCLTVDYLCVSTLLLIYVSLSEKEELKEIRDLMCIKLDTPTQLNIVEFLHKIQEHENIFNFSFIKIKEEVLPHIFLNFKEKHFVQSSGIGDGILTPVKNESSNVSFDSPLQGFFKVSRQLLTLKDFWAVTPRSVLASTKCLGEVLVLQLFSPLLQDFSYSGPLTMPTAEESAKRLTPKRNVDVPKVYSYNMYGDGDHIKRIKKLSDQLVEEESEKTSLLEQLNIQTQKCNEFEIKLKNKIEEINHIKDEWEKESKKYEEEVYSLKNNLAKKLENEKKLKNEISHLESYVSSLELDFSNCTTKYDKLENKLKNTLEKLTSNEEQLKSVTELCLKLQSTIKEKEKELEEFKENYTNFYNSDEKAIDVSFMNGSSDRSICSPENLGVVVDKLLREKIEENTSLGEIIEGLQAEKGRLLNEVKLFNEQLELKNSVISELQFLNKELCAKVENLEKIEKELVKVQNELFNANAEINKLTKENSHLTEKYNLLNCRLQEREQTLINSNNSKMLLQINLLKLAEDFKAVQQRLEIEVQNISKLPLDKYENELITEVNSGKVTEFKEVKNFKDLLSSKTSNNDEQEPNILKIKDETNFLYNFSFLRDNKFCKLTEFLLNFENDAEWLKTRNSLQKTYNQLNDNIIVLRPKLREIEEHHINSLETISKLKKDLKEAEDKSNKIQSNNIAEITKLKQELEEKENKIKELEKFSLHFKKVEEELLLEKEIKMQEAKMLLKDKDLKIIHEGGDHNNIKADIKAVDNVFVEHVGKLQAPCERQEFNDSLEEVPVVNKTFDIVNLEEKNISDKTFSIKKEDQGSLDKTLKSCTTWVVSPPSKVPLKIPSKEIVKRQESKYASGESWVVLLDPGKAKESKVKKVSSSVNDLRMKTEEMKIFQLRKEISNLSIEIERLKSALLDSEQKRKKDKEIFEKNQEIIRQNITAKYESQLEHLKNEMKQLYNRELAKHKHEQSNLSSELQEQNKRYKEHIDELRNQLWDLGEKLLQEQTVKRVLERNFNELKEKYENLIFSRESDTKSFHPNETFRQKESSVDVNVKTSLWQMPSATFPTIPTEDEDEVFDNRFLEDMKIGICKTERPEERLKELQYRNSLCLPHLKSSYPGETQFHNPTLFKESELKYGLLPLIQESQSLTDSDHSMTKSLLPDCRGKRKEQTSYKKPGPPTPSKNGGRLSIQSSDVKLTPRNVLKEIHDQNERNKGTPNPLKLLLSSKNGRRGSTGSKDENTAPVTPKKKKFFRKPFGARDH